MQKVLIGLVVFVALGVGGFIFWQYRGEQEAFAKSVEFVDKAVEATEKEDASAARLHSSAVFMLEPWQKGSTWVNAERAAAQYRRLADAKAAALKKRPLPMVLFRLGEAYTWGIITYQFAKPEIAEKHFANSDVLTWEERGNNLSFLTDIPFNYSARRSHWQTEPAAKQQFVREKLDEMTKAIEAKHGATNRDLFQLSSTAVLAFLAADRMAVFPDEAKGYPQKLTQLAQAAKLPDNLWKPYVNGLETGVPKEQLAAQLAEFLNKTSEYLAPPAAPPGGGSSKNDGTDPNKR